MIRAGQTYTDIENNEYLIFGIAEGTKGEFLVILKNKVTRKFYAKTINVFENEFVLSI